MTSRHYTSPKRHAGALATRQRILEAAEELFSSLGYAATTFPAIAKRAGVSVQSVHLVGTKASLIMNAFSRSFAGAEETERLTERPFVRQIMADPDSERALRSYLDFIVGANERVAQLWRTIHAAADSDESVRTALDGLESRRKADMHLACAWLVKRGFLRDDREAAAADVLTYVTTPDTYLHFVRDSGWSLEQYRQWLSDAIRCLVMDPLERARNPERPEEPVEGQPTTSREGF